MSKTVEQIINQKSWSQRSMYYLLDALKALYNSPTGVAQLDLRDEHGWSGTYALAAVKKGIQKKLFVVIAQHEHDRQEYPNGCAYCSRCGVFMGREGGEPPHGGLPTCKCWGDIRFMMPSGQDVERAIEAVEARIAKDPVTRVEGRVVRVGPAWPLTLKDEVET